MARILLVDHRADSSEPMAFYLRQQGYTIEQAPNARTALAQILEYTPDLVLLDLSMPALDLSNLVETIGSYIRLHSLPLIVLTSENSPDLGEAFKLLRITRVVFKSWMTTKDISAAIDEALSTVHPGAGIPLEKWRRDDISPL